MTLRLLPLFASVATVCFCAGPAAGQYRMEHLDRGVVAIKQNDGRIHVGWRLLGTDTADTAFNLYRISGTGEPVKLNTTPLLTTTDFVDTGASTDAAQTYFVRPVTSGTEQTASRVFTVPAGAVAQPYLSLPLDTPPDGTVPGGGTHFYRANDCSAADLDGDGEYELVVKWEPSNAQDNSKAGYTGNVLLDAYTLAGRRLWRIDLGRNIRAGAHYTQFLVYDFDGDGRAELACKTADGTVDGAGTVIGDATADHRNSSGYVLSGPEFLTVFDGRTGRALATADYLPPRGNVANWGDGYGNRVDRFLACVAYLDGQRPSLVMCRGYYTRAVLAAWDWRDGRLSQRWVFDSTDGRPGSAEVDGEGNHNLSVADVDGDGRQEIVYGSATIDDDGRALYSTELHHGDALHVSDLDPSRPGLEVWACHEDTGNNGHFGLTFRAAATGTVLFGVPVEFNTSTGKWPDVGRGIAMDIDPRFPGSELWGATGGLYSATGNQISTNRPSSMNHAVWWDADHLREIFDGSNNEGGSSGAPRVDKWNWETGTTTRLLDATGCHVNNWTKANPCLTADLLGDWREEIVLRSADSRELRIYTTTIPAVDRLPTLMHDPQYRVAISWQNSGYNQPPHPGYFLGDGMNARPLPDPAIAVVPPLDPPGPISRQPESRFVSAGAGTTLSVGTEHYVQLAYQWFRNGRQIAGATASTLGLAAVSASDVGLYDCMVSGNNATVSAPAVVGLVPATGERTAGAVFTRPEWQNIHHPNGATYDQFLLSGTAGTFTADPGEIARMSYLDPNGSIVQVEMSGAGAITVVLDPATASGPKAPALYNQSGVEYMQGKATIVLAGADATTHFTIYSVGTATNPGVTKPDAAYVGWADVAAAGIVTTDGKLGGIHQGNANYNATVGYAGLYAPGVATVNGLVVIHDITASDFARPLLQFAPGGTVNVKIAGGSLSQPSGDALTVDGLAKLTLGAGQDSCGRPAPAQPLATRLLAPDGTDVTTAVIGGP